MNSFPWWSVAALAAAVGLSYCGASDLLVVLLVVASAVGAIGNWASYLAVVSRVSSLVSDDDDEQVH